MYRKQFWLETGERAVKTWAQTLVALFGAGTFDLLEVDWVQAAGVSFGAALLSVLSSIGSAKVTHHDDPSLV